MYEQKIIVRNMIGYLNRRVVFGSALERGEQHPAQRFVVFA